MEQMRSRSVRRSAESVSENVVCAVKGFRSNRFVDLYCFGNPQKDVLKSLRPPIKAFLYFLVCSCRHMFAINCFLDS